MSDRPAHVVGQVDELRDMLDQLTDAAVLAAHYLLDVARPDTNAHEQAQVTLMIARDAAVLLGKREPCETCGTVEPSTSNRHHRHLRVSIEDEFCPHRGCDAGPFKQVKNHHPIVHRGDHDPNCSICRSYVFARQAARC